MHKDSNSILLEIDQLIETFTEQYRTSRENSRIIPLIEIDLMKNSLQNLYKQLHRLGKLQENIQPENLSAIPGMSRTDSVNLSFTDKKESTFYPESEINIPSDNSITFAELLIENETEEILIPEKTFIEEKQISKTIIAENNSVATARINNYVHTSPLVEPPSETKPEISKIDFAEQVTTSKLEISAEEREIPQRKEDFFKKQAATLFDDHVETVGGKYKEQETLYSQISKTRKDETVADKLHRKPLADLKKSIGINERFALINELFAGNQQHFTESIDKINSFSSYEEAHQLLNGELAKRFNWDTASASLTLLDNLIKRRFGM